MPLGGVPERSNGAGRKPLRVQALGGFKSLPLRLHLAGTPGTSFTPCDWRRRAPANLTADGSAVTLTGAIGDHRPRRTAAVDRPSIAARAQSSVCCSSSSLTPARRTPTERRDRARVPRRATCSHSRDEPLIDERLADEPRLVAPAEPATTAAVFVAATRRSVRARVRRRRQGRARGRSIASPPILGCVERATAPPATSRQCVAGHASGRSSGGGSGRPRGGSKRRSRCFPTAVTDSGRRPSTREATPVTDRAGSGSGPRSLYSSTCRRRAAR